MSNASNNRGPKDLSDEDLKRAYDGQSVDWFLQQLVDMANLSENFEFGITLNVHGSLISGVLISGKKYFSEFADQFMGSVKASWAQELHKVIAGHGDVYDAPSDDERYPPNFIHLRDAHLHHPSGVIPTNGGVLWRGKINSVSAFNLGILTQSIDQE